MNPSEIPPIKQALLRQRQHIRQALWLSSVMGVLVLVPSWYMFEVYGRVLNSRNTTTLAWLVVMTLGVYVVLELLDLVRARLLHNVGEAFERELRPRVFQAALQAQSKRVAGGSMQALSDLKAIKDLIASPFVKALLDVPAALPCLLLLFLLGFWLGVLGLIGAAVQVWLIWVTQRHTLPLLMQASSASIQAHQYANGALRNAQVIESMGMLPRTHEHWLKRQHQFLGKQAEASDYGGMTGAVAKLLQLMQGSVLLGGGHLGHAAQQPLGRRRDGDRGLDPGRARAPATGSTRDQLACLRAGARRPRAPVDTAQLVPVAASDDAATAATRPP